jgi:hypothetical protein
MEKTLITFKILCLIWSDITTPKIPAHVERSVVVNENSGLFSCFVQAKAVIMVLLTSYSAYRGYKNAQKADTEEYQRLYFGKLKEHHNSK